MLELQLAANRLYQTARIGLVALEFQRSKGALLLQTAAVGRAAMHHEWD